MLFWYELKIGPIYWSTPGIKSIYDREEQRDTLVNKGRIHHVRITEVINGEGSRGNTKLK